MQGIFHQIGEHLGKQGARTQKAEILLNKHLHAIAFTGGAVRVVTDQLVHQLGGHDGGLLARQAQQLGVGDLGVDLAVHAAHQVLQPH
ncbi:hypothetical protein D9M68_920300 [compost metagenome]